MTKIRNLLVVLVLLGVGHAKAALTTNNWIAGSGKWETAGNWSAGAPTITHSANLVTNAVTKTVTIDAATPAGTLTISNLVISGPAGTVNTLQLTNAPSSTLHILDTLVMASGGVLTISNSAVRIDDSSGTISILDGSVFLQSGSFIDTNSATFLSESGGGSLTISNGLAQFGQMYLALLGGAGTLTVAGGTNQLLSSFGVGIQMEVTGMVWVTGGQLVVTNGSTTLGGAGFGQMTVSNGAALLNDLSIGNYSNEAGALLVTGGSVQLSSFLSIGSVTDATGVVRLTGGQLLVPNSYTYVGDTGTGQMVVSNATWRGSILVVGYAPGSSGTLTLIGATNQVANFMTVGGQGSLPGQTGAVWLTGGLLVTTNGGANVGSTGIGQMTVSNATWLTSILEVGSFGGAPTSAKGTLTFVGGTTTISSIFAVGAEDTTATGAVWLTSGQLSITNSPSYVGWYGVGQMTVSNGSWRPNNVFVGYVPSSQGTLTIAGGTNLLSSYLDIGAQANSTGTVWLTGGQLIVTNSETLLSEGGVGQMIISNGTFLTGSLFFADPSTACGSLTMAGGTITILGDFNMHNGTQTVWLTGGQLSATNGTTLIGDLDVGRMTVSNGLWRARNVIIGNAPGSQGTLTVAGGVSSIYSNVTIGSTNCSAPGFVFVTGGEFHVTNDAVTAVLEVRDGTLIQTGGLLDIDRLVVTNPCAHFIHLGGTLIIGLQTLTPGFDADGDGIPNGYELANGLDPLNPADANLDNDGDGMSNLQEYLAGTDPNDSASSFRITSIVRTGGNLRVTWMTGPGKTNELQRSTGDGGSSYNTNNFAAIFTVTNTAGTTTNYLDSGVMTNSTVHYYRVRLVP